MPKQHTITTYTWDELTEEQQEVALSKYYDINVYYDWWDSVYEDANMIGLKITAFNIDRGNYVDMQFESGGSMLNTINLIIDNHGDMCDTFKIAKRYEQDIDKAVESCDDYPDEYLDELEHEFLQEMKTEYLSMLKSDYEYLTSDEAIKETLINNDYDFKVDTSEYTAKDNVYIY